MTVQEPMIQEAVPASDTAQHTQTVIGFEVLAYTVLAVFSGVLRMLRLGDAPLTPDELPRALAAWRAVPTGVPGPQPLADSAVLQFWHQLSFVMLGPNEIAVRGMTALAGVALVLAPLLFRSLLGRTRTFAFSTLLALSSVLLAASRLSSPVIWEMILALLALWALWRFIESESNGYAIACTILAVSTATLAGPTGLILMIVLIGALVAAATLAGDIDWRASLAAWPWLIGGSLAALIVVIVSTGFMFYLSGFNAVAQALGDSITGWWQPPPNGAPVFFAVFASLHYELVLWFFAIWAGVRLSRRGTIAFVDAFLSIWGVLAALVLLFYGGATAAHALWLTIPLVGLTTLIVEDMVSLRNDDDWYLEESLGWYVPDWARWVVSGVTALLVALLVLHMRTLGRSALNIAPDVPPVEAATNLGLPLLIVLVLLMLLVFGGFTAASLIGGRATIRGMGFGVLAFGMVTSLGTGWQITTTRAADPVSLWHVQATAPETLLLRDTLLQIADRESRGFTTLPVTVVMDNEAITTDGAVMWVLRDFQNVAIVSTAESASGQTVIVAPLQSEPPDLGGSYVGQSFVITRGWDIETLQARGLLSWWQQGRATTPAYPAQQITLWLRQDIYDGASFDES